MYANSLPPSLSFTSTSSLSFPLFLVLRPLGLFLENGLFCPDLADLNFMLLTPYFARNSAGIMCPSLVTIQLKARDESFPMLLLILLLNSLHVFANFMFNLHREIYGRERVKSIRVYSFFFISVRRTISALVAKIS